MEKILALIPARGGSKGVPRKNIRPVAGKPLIAYSIEAALSARDMLYRVVVSTEDEQIAATARQLGAETPFLRPADLANDKSPMVPVVRHAVQFIEQQDGVQLDWVLLLQPTALFRTADDIRAAVALAHQGGSDSVISVVQVFSTHPILMKKIENDHLLPYCIEEKEGTRRQDYQPPAFMRNGAIYLVRRDVVVEKGSMWGDLIRPYVMPEERSVNIDSEMDLRLAELMLAEHKQA
ncbi:MAG: acylneuraminate cytidylyltransferase family protein [Anaerolineaceae bacterium]|jgi:CMP-N-acetylneuraminic acid synthetase